MQKISLPSPQVHELGEMSRVLANLVTVKRLVLLFSIASCALLKYFALVVTFLAHTDKQAVLNSRRPATGPKPNKH